MKLKILVVLPIAALALVGCEDAPDVSARENPSDVGGQVSIEKAEVRDADRSACGAIPLSQLANDLGVDIPEPQTIANRFAKPWPSELEDTVRSGCLAGLGGG